MRDFKFRAWDKKNKYMEEVDGCNLYIADNELYEVCDTSYAYQSYMDKQNVTEKYEVMQYIGVNDINNKEIYEGDIVKNSTGRIMYVTWFSSQKFNGWDLIALNCIGSANPRKLWEDIQVIGNQFENPELIPDVED